MFTLYYLILGERKALGEFPTWIAAWGEARRRRHNYCGSALYISDPCEFNRKYDESAITRMRRRVAGAHAEAEA